MIIQTILYYKRFSNKNILNIGDSKSDYKNFYFWNCYYQKSF